MNEVYLSLKTTAHPWMIRRWAETKGADSKLLVAKEEHVIEDVRLAYTKDDLGRLNSYITNPKAEQSDHISTVIHERSLACLSMSWAENDTVYRDGEDQYQYRQ